MEKNEDQSDTIAAQDAPDRYTHEEAAELPKSAFDGAIDRRSFLRVAAVTGAALALPGAVSASVTDDAMTDLAEFAVNATPEAYEATLVIEFSGVEDLETFAEEYAEPDWSPEESLRAPKAVTREEPTPGAHAALTAEELDDAFSLSDIEFVDYSPGANPFWKLEGPYADGVFPDVVTARDWISHREAGQALDHLAAEYPDKVSVQRIGEGPGWENFLTGDDPDRRDIHVAELTNNVQDEESFRKKDKAVFAVGIHGNERAGVEAGSRLIEAAAKGEADDINQLLDDIVIVYVYINPDGWTVRNPHHGPHPHNEFVDGTFYGHYRGNSSEVDTNRQYPTIGWTNPAFWPAEPEKAPERRPGYDVGYGDVVPDALATVSHLREYKNVEYLCDYHMMGWADTMVLNLESNAAYDHDGTHDLDEVNRRIGDAMEDHWGSPAAIAADTVRAGQDTAGLDEYVPDRLLDYGSIYDSLGYNVTGGLLGWAGQPEESGGLGAITVAPELAMRDFATWRPYIERHLATAYRLSMREYATLCAADTNATVATGGQDTAYLTTEALTRTSADLSHTDESPGEGHGPGQDRATHVQRRHETVHPGPTAATSSANDRTHSLAARFVEPNDKGVVDLINPGGQRVHRIDLSTSDQKSFYVPDPEPGEWSIEVDGDDEIEIEFVTTETAEEHPDPEEAFGYPQTEYVVNPMQFFADLESHLENGEMDGLRVHDVRVGRLTYGNTSKRRYDKLVISHEEGRDDQRYISAIESFVAAGGDLVLTDSGLYLLDALEIGETEDISGDDIQTAEADIVNLINRDFDHHLLSDIRGFQHEIWKSSQIGYVPEAFDQPTTLIDDSAFEAAGGDVAGRMEIGESNGGNAQGVSGVAAGSLSANGSKINLIGSVLPPANQRELHPFGMAEYAVSFMGHTLLCNALGFQQRRFVEGELVGTWGNVR